MANAPEVVKAPGLVPDEQKFEPRSKGISTARKKKPKELAVITECCTGCAGSPACVEYCPVEDCMFWLPVGRHRHGGYCRSRKRSRSDGVLRSPSLDFLYTNWKYEARFLSCYMARG